MSARVTIDESVAESVWIELRENGAEVVRFAAFAAIMLAALYRLVPGARTAPAVWLALVGVAAGWSAVALAGREVYTIDTGRGTIAMTASSVLGWWSQGIPVDEVSAVRLSVGGPDDNRRMIDLLAADGTTRIRLPRCLTTLSEHDQAEIGRLFAERLDVPLHGMHRDLVGFRVGQHLWGPTM
jgi:hypothetical protein